MQKIIEHAKIINLGFTSTDLADLKQGIKEIDRANCILDEMISQLVFEEFDANNIDCNLNELMSILTCSDINKIRQLIQLIQE